MDSTDQDDTYTDTDTKLAMLASLLEPASFPIEDLLDALQGSKGDVAKSAEVLLLPRVRSAGKRKAGTSLQSWLGKKQATFEQPGASRKQEPKAIATATAHDDLSATAKNTPGSRSTTTTTATTKNGKPTVDLMSVLKQPTTPEKAKTTPRPALHLPNQSAINTYNLPLTLLSSPLSPSFASALYLMMMEESQTWERNRFYLAGKWVESPHTVCHYARDPPSAGASEREGEAEAEAVVGTPVPAAAPVPVLDGKEGKEGKKAMYMWSGQEIESSRMYPALLREAALMIEPVVDAAIRSRPRYPYEWAGPWRASVCGANRYDGAGSSVGWHADQLTYLGPYTTIASLSLGTPRAFRLRPTETVDPTAKSSPTRTYEVTLGHNSLVLMNAGCQERYKHTVPTQKALDLFRPAFDLLQEPIPVDKQTAHTSRINITFRFYREDFHPTPNPAGPFGKRQGTPYCKCGIPTLLRADQKAKARSKIPIPVSPRTQTDQKVTRYQGQPVVNDDMVFFWQCQSPGQTGDMKGCGFFRILDMKAEGRGPCIKDLVDSCIT